MIFLFFILLTHSYVHPWLREGGMPAGLQKSKNKREVNTSTYFKGNYRKKNMVTKWHNGCSKG